MAIKHNNIVPNVHFRKWWQKYVRTWFNQAGRKKTRRTARQLKAEKVAPRPVGLLRPAVHPPTQRYNFKLRAGRGFTFDELKKAGIQKDRARTIGVAVDHRRRNHCEESLNANVARLEEYKSKLMLMPLKNKARKGDSTRAEIKTATAAAPCKTVLPITQETKRTKKVVITSDMKQHSAYRILRKAREVKKYFGRKIKRAADKEASKKQK